MPRQSTDRPLTPLCLRAGYVAALGLFMALLMLGGSRVDAQEECPPWVDDCGDAGDTSPPSIYVTPYGCTVNSATPISSTIDWRDQISLNESATATLSNARATSGPGTLHNPTKDSTCVHLRSGLVNECEQNTLLSEPGIRAGQPLGHRHDPGGLLAALAVSRRRERGVDEMAALRA